MSRSRRSSWTSPRRYIGVVTQQAGDAARAEDDEDDQPRPGPRPPRVPHSLARPDRLPFRVSHRHAGHGSAQPPLRRLRAVAGADPRAVDGALVADRTGRATAYAIFHLQSRGTFFIGDGQQVYEGMIVGENTRARTTWTSTSCKEKKLTNMRAAGTDEALRLVPPRMLSLERPSSSSTRTSWWRSPRVDPDAEEDPRRRETPPPQGVAPAPDFSSSRLANGDYNTEYP